MWDSADADKDNIVTVIALVDSPDVIDQLYKTTTGFWAESDAAILNPSEDPEMRELETEALRAANASFGKEMAVRDRQWIAEAVEEAKASFTSDRMAAVQNLRDKHIAHLLAVSRRDKRGEVRPMKYGDEKELLEVAVRIVEKMRCAVSGKGFQFEDSWANARRDAGELWGACRFNFDSDPDKKQ